MRVEDVLDRVELQRGDDCGVVYGDIRRTWSDIGHRVRSVAGALVDMGLKSGDTVAVLSPNSDRYMELFFAVPRAGGVIVPLNIRWSVAEIVEALTGCGARILFVSEEFAPLADRIASAVSSLEVVADLDPTGSGRPSYDGMIESGPRLDHVVPGPDLLAIFYTGGTTGAPKGVMLSHSNIIASGLSWVAELKHRKDAVQLQVGGFFHLSGLAHLFYVTMIGATNVLIPKFEPELAMKAISDNKVTHTLLLPTMINMMLNHPRMAEYDLSSVNLCIYGGSPMSETALLAFMKKLPTWKFIQAFAMTESASLGTFLDWDHHVTADGKPHPMIGSAGRAALGMNVKIVASGGGEASPGRIGEIALKSLSIATGYYRNPTATAETFRDGWLMTGDLGYMTEDGFVYVVDRAKDMIVTGGENVYSVEVEKAVMTLEGVVDCAVIGVPSDTWGEAVCAVIVTKPGAPISPDRVKSHCAGLIGSYKCPKVIELREEPLPMTPAGKIRKDVLKEPYWSKQKKMLN